MVHGEMNLERTDHREIAPHHHPAETLKRALIRIRSLLQLMPSPKVRARHDRRRGHHEIDDGKQARASWLSIPFDTLIHPWISFRDCWRRSKSEGDNQEVIGSQLMSRVMLLPGCDTVSGSSSSRAGLCTRCCLVFMGNYYPWS